MIDHAPWHALDGRENSWEDASGRLYSKLLYLNLAILDCEVHIGCKFQNSALFFHSIA